MRLSQFHLKDSNVPIHSSLPCGQELPEEFSENGSTFCTGYKKVSQKQRKNKKLVSTLRRFCVSYANSKNMERCNNNGMPSILWKCVLPFQHHILQKIRVNPHPSDTRTFAVPEAKKTSYKSWLQN